MAADMEEVLIADMQHWRDVLRISFIRTVGSKYLLNKKYLPLLVLSMDRLNTLGWILSSTLTVQSRIWMSLSLPPSLAIRPWCLLPAQNQDLWLRERRRPNLTGTHTSIWFRSFWRPQADLVHMPRNSSTTCCEMLTTHQLLSETLGPPSKVFFTVPSPNNNSNGAVSSGFVSSSLLPCSTISSQLTAGPTRNGTGDVMPLAEAITQLSFLEFLQRCGVSIAPPQPSQPPVPISLLDAAVQTTPPCDVSQEVSTQTSDQQDTLSCDVAVQTSSHGTHILSLDAAAQTTSPSTLSQHVSTQMGSRSASSFSVDMFAQTPVRSAVLRDVATQLPLTEFFTDCIYSNNPLDRRNFVRQSPPSTQGSHPLLQPPPGLEQPAPPPELASYSHLLTTHGASTNSFPSHAQQSPVSTTIVGTHPVRTATSAKRSASTALAGTHNPVGSDPRTGTGPFPKPRALVLPMVNFGQPKSDRLGHINTVDSDLMHHQFRLSLLQWNPGPARKYPTNIVFAACGKFHAVILQEASDHVPKISDQFMAFTGNTDLAILAQQGYL